MNFEETVVWNRLRNGQGDWYTEAAEGEREEFRRFVKGLLVDGIVTIEFIKSDGTTRIMTCTLNEDKGAKYTDSTENLTITEGKFFVDGHGDAHPVKKPKKVNTDSQKVWDCDKSEWRSFRWDRLKRIDFKIG